MSTVAIKELKNRLTEYLRRTKKGEEIIVTDRGKPIAVIQPIESATTHSLVVAERHQPISASVCLASSAPGNPELSSRARESARCAPA